MKLPKGAITSLAERGYTGIQVPGVAIRQHDTEDYPDSWFMGSGTDTPAMSGVLLLSPKGYQANKDALLSAFASCTIQRGIPWVVTKNKALLELVAELTEPGAGGLYTPKDPELRKKLFNFIALAEFAYAKEGLLKKIATVQKRLDGLQGHLHLFED